MNRRYISKASTMKRFNEQTCNNNPNKLFVFGDNCEGRGMAGQACIRNCHNSFGIPTKKKTVYDGRFFYERLYPRY